MNAEAEVKLNVGAGETEIPGYVPIDRKLGTEVFPLECEDGSVDEIRASHVLEHFSHRDAFGVVRHWVQKLRPGGYLRIAVPDFEYIARHYLDGEPIPSQVWMFGSHKDENDFHRAGFDRETLDEAMIDAGLERLHSWESEIRDCASLPVSLNRGGYKPTAASFDPKRIRVLLSNPRYGPTMHYRLLWEAITKTGIRGQIAQGAYWSQILSELMEAAIAKDSVDYVITLDYDSILRPEDLVELCRLVRTSDDVHAVCAVQQRRRNDHTLFTLPGKAATTPAATFERYLTRVGSGHFGCTVFRAESLRTLARPWMLPRPDEAGRWTDESVDADVNFWERWQDSGRSLYLANRVVIGHLDEVIEWPGQDFRTVHQSISDYTENGPPAEVKRCA